MSTYRTKQGDMWDQIAYDAYGDERYAETLLKANRGHLDVLIFEAGAVLTLPDVETDEDLRPEVRPRWQR